MPRTSVGQSDLKLTNRAIKVASWKEGRSDTHPRPPPPADVAEPRPRAAGPRRARTPVGRHGGDVAAQARPFGAIDVDTYGPRRRGWVLLLPGRVAPPMRCRRPTFSSSFIYTTIRVIMVTGGLARGQRPVCRRVAAASGRQRSLLFILAFRPLNWGDAWIQQAE